jgi:hypothetical protein
MLTVAVMALVLAGVTVALPVMLLPFMGCSVARHGTEAPAGDDAEVVP